MADEIDLTPFTKQLEGGLAAGRPAMLATADKAGNVDIGPKGSIFVFDKDHLAYLERTHRGHLANLRENPHVAIIYFNRDAEFPNLRFYGTAEIHESGATRDEIRNRTIPAEVSRDPENKGLGVLIKVDRVALPPQQPPRPA